MDFENIGTPKTLDEAIATAVSFGPLSGLKDRAHAILKDYLAQKFGVAMLKHPEHSEMLKQLFETICKR